MRNVLAATLLVIGLAVAGCGGGGSPANNASNGNGEAAKSAQQVVADAVKAADAAGSLHMSGQVDASGRQIALDLNIVTKKGATGSFTLGGQKIDLVIDGTDAYLKAGAGFYQQFAGANGSAIGQMMAGKWLKFSTSNPQFGPLLGIASSKTIFDQMSSSGGKLTNKGTTTY